MRSVEFDNANYTLWKYDVWWEYNFNDAANGFGSVVFLWISTSRVVRPLRLLAHDVAFSESSAFPFLLSIQFYSILKTFG